MSKKDSHELILFLEPFGEEIAGLVLWLRDFVWDRYPQSNELIYDNYNALAFGWSVTEKLGHTFCSIAVGRTSNNIHFGFYWGSKIADPQHLLIGNGNQYRYLLVKSKAAFPEKDIENLVADAYAYSLLKVKDGQHGPTGLTIVKSVSPVKREKKIKEKK